MNANQFTLHETFSPTPPKHREVPPTPVPHQGASAINEKTEVLPSPSSAAITALPWDPTKGIPRVGTPSMYYHLVMTNIGKP